MAHSLHLQLGFDDSTCSTMRLLCRSHSICFHLNISRINVAINQLLMIPGVLIPGRFSATAIRHGMLKPLQMKGPLAVLERGVRRPSSQVSHTDNPEAVTLILPHHVGMDLILAICHRKIYVHVCSFLIYNKKNLLGKCIKTGPFTVRNDGLT